ncbi:MAG TPA: tetratricopeptide repeat protein [Thermoanaerobaculia bacterium]|jgi:tetratricopeptide (TPR) repeat protein
MTRAAALCLTALLAAPLAAHDGVHDQIERATRRLAAEPKNAALYLHRAELYRLHQDWDRARADYTRAAKLDPRLEIVDFARGRMELEAGRPAAARTSLDRFLGRNPGHAEARLTRARTLVQLKKAEEAIADYDAAIAHVAQPTPDLYHERAKVLADLGRVDDALRGLDEGMTRLGTLVSLQRPAIDLELAAARYDRALARLDTITTRRELYLADRADILLKAGRVEEAQAAYREALQRLAALPEEQQNSRVNRALVARIQGALATPPPPNTR